MSIDWETMDGTRCCSKFGQCEHHSCTDHPKVKALVADLNGIEHDLRTWDGKIAPVHVANWIHTAVKAMDEVDNRTVREVQREH